MQLSDIAIFVEQSIRSTDISLSEYVTTDSILQNREGRTMATNLPPTPCNLTSYQPGDILIANIRPYLKKVWMADTTGGCSADVLVFRAKENVSSEYLYSVLLQDSFFDYVMLAPKGSKMPRGDKDHIMRFPICDLPNDDTIKVGDLICKIEAKLANNRKQNAILEKLAKQIYDYWFVQFDFPNENGRPYKSSGGKMVWNETLKREVPDGWEDGIINDCIEPIERGISYSSDDIVNPNGQPMINLACFSKQGEYRTGAFKFYSGTIKDKNKGYPLDMFIACTDMTQDAEVIGRPILATKEYDYYIYSMDLAKITPKNIKKMYLYYTLRTPFYHKYIKPFASGTNVKHLNVEGIKEYKISIPPIGLQQKFETIMSSIKEKQMIIINEQQSLTQLREKLLPLLMTGQVKLK